MPMNRPLGICKPDSGPRQTHPARARRPLVCLCLLALAVFAPAPAHAQGNTYAVLVGVSKYKDSSNDLAYAHKDAHDMYRLLKPLAGEKRLAALTDERATRTNVVKALESVFYQAKPEDLVLFFFSGHGNEGRFFLHDRTLTFDDLSKIFNNTKAARKVIFADACHSGTLRAQGGEKKNGGRSAGDSVMLFLSSRDYQYSAEILNWKNGRFTQFLLEGLNGSADANGDKVVTAIELFGYVYPRVKKWSYGSQVPVMWGRFDENMAIVRVK